MRINNLSKTKQAFFSSTGLKQTAWSSLGSITASGLAALATILITRVLGPTQFGQFSAAFALMLILIRLNDAGLSTATTKFMAQAADKSAKAQVFKQVLKYRLILSALILLIGSIFAQTLASLLNLDLKLVLLALVLSQATVYFEHLQYSLQALHAFKKSALVNIIQAVFKFLPAVLLTLAILPVNQFLIFSLYMLAPAIPVVFIYQLLPQYVFKTNQVGHQLKTQIKNLAQHSAINLISAGIIENIDLLFVSAYLSEYETGLLGGISRIALLLYVLAYALGSVLNARVAQYQQKQDLQKYWKKAWLVCLVAVIGFGLSLPLAKPLITLTIGPQYLPGLDLMLVLLAAGFVTIAVIPFIALFYSFELPWYFSLSGIMQLAIVLIGNGLFVPIYGLSAAVWSRLIARLLLFLVTVGLATWQYQKTLKSDVDPH